MWKSIALNTWHWHFHHMSHARLTFYELLDFFFFMLRVIFLLKKDAGWPCCKHMLPVLFIFYFCWLADVSTPPSCSVTVTWHGCHPGLNRVAFSTRLLAHVSTHHFWEGPPCFKLMLPILSAVSFSVAVLLMLLFVFLFFFVFVCQRFGLYFFCL